MITFPNAKINLGLHVTAKRNDGYHEIETVFYPIPWKDALECTPADKLALSIAGLSIDGPVTNNLVWRAYALLAQDHDLAPVQLHLLKKIPFGAGLGGGSADGAFALQLLNEYFALGLDDTQLQAYAAQLGSDCPFFIDNRPALGTGRGEQLTPLSIDLSPYHLVVIYPGLTVDTGWAYGQLSPQAAPKPLREVIAMPVEDWEIYLTNDFEGPVFARYPTLEMIKLELYEAGATYAAMSGSGSAVFGLFTEPQDEWAIAQHFSLPREQVLSASL